MKSWMVNNKGLTIVLAMMFVALLVMVIVGPTIWSAILAAHGF